MNGGERESEQRGAPRFYQERDLPPGEEEEDRRRQRFHVQVPDRLRRETMPTKYDTMGLSWLFASYFALLQTLLPQFDHLSSCDTFAYRTDADLQYSAER